jgi:hypothetical protein
MLYNVLNLNMITKFMDLNLFHSLRKYAVLFDNEDSLASNEYLNQLSKLFISLCSDSKPLFAVRWATIGLVGQWFYLLMDVKY